MALIIAKVGGMIEVQVDGDSPSIITKEALVFDKTSTGMRVKILKGPTVNRAFTWAQLNVNGSVVSDYSDFKTKLALVIP